MGASVTESVFSFLKKLENNNNRDWFNENKKEFKNVEGDVKQVYNVLLEKLRLHDDIDKLKLFRIYRDVRFSKNKLPYKTNFGGAYHRTKPHLRGGYYMHLQANNESFIAAGFWEPNTDDLLRIRKEFEMDDTEIRAILNAKSFNSVWGNSFAGESVKTAPKGFNKDHAAIDLIKMKQFMFIKKYTDTQVISQDFLEHVTNDFKAVRPFFDYMSEVLTTDLNGVSLIG